MRLLRLGFKSNNKIKSKAIKYIAKRYSPIKTMKTYFVSCIKFLALEELNKID